MNKNILKYIPMLMALLMVSCSSDDTLEGNAPSVQVTPELIDDKYEITGTKSGYVDYLAQDNHPLTRTALQYNRKTNVMKSSWVAGDKIGVFYYNTPENTQQIAFILDPNEEIISSETSETGIFIKGEDAVGYEMRPNDRYVSYIPYMDKNQDTGDFGYEAIPVTFKGQHQTANVKMNSYFLMETDDDEHGVKYHASEKAASAHLAAFDYQVSNVISTPTAHVHFNYTSLSSIVRFYMYAPDAIYFDSLQVVNHDADFVLDATMNVGDGTLTPKNNGTGHVMSLSFVGADGVGKGIDMTNKTDESVYTYDYWRTTTGKGYIMAYMMIAPIKLKECASYSTLYLCGHDNNGVKHYYKATLSKINFEAGKHHQWVATTSEDEPITFTKVTVQEWKSHVYNNTKDGNGTATW